MRTTLVIVPCGRCKIWDTQPDHGPARAADAYTSRFFMFNRAYAERFGDAWIVLSAKYGFVTPDLLIPGPYDVTFKRRSSDPISHQRLAKQVDASGMDEFEVVIGLGGKEYRKAITDAFEGTPVSLLFPFSGQPIGIMMSNTKRAVDELSD